MQSNKVQQAQNHHTMTTAGNEGIPKSNPLLLGIDVFIKGKEGREADQEINPIKGRPNSVRHVAILKGIIREGTDGQRLHEGSEV